MDGLNRGELAQLTSLSAVGLGINSLTGLEWAVNLTSADLRNNNITTAAPLTGLTQLTNLQLAGNPLTGNPLGIGSTSTKTVPAMPLFAQIFLLIGLSWVSLQPSRRQRS
jgi:Leucine-rich repeat (LRR) protein